ncbi:hypothetical protein QQF64_018592 [Cirrhinus molitorella]|uniref:Uncharacterized protein n=1 Tax=Cirrhinus molitorella TaxID=172907 RepID=A0ABR3LFP9_9TELE
MLLIKEESEDIRIEEVFSLKDTEEQTDLMALKKEVLKESVISMLEAIGKPMACCSEGEMEEDKEEEKHEHNGERHREDEGVQEKERKEYNVLGRLTAQGKTYQTSASDLACELEKDDSFGVVGRRLLGLLCRCEDHRLLFRCWPPLLCAVGCAFQRAPSATSLGSP